jgi:pyruvyltransferase
MLTMPKGCIKAAESGNSNQLKRVILARWYEETPNFGDALNPVIIELVSGIRPINLQHFRCGYWKLTQMLSRHPKPEYMVIGSTLGWGFRRPNVTVFWGPGFMFSAETVRTQPRKVCAVRGPLSREKLLSQGIACPAIFGDPALLLPKYYRPQMRKKYVLGIVPHYTDRQSRWLTSLSAEKDVLIIDVGAPVFDVVNNILSCERIASSSLHGIIVADAYGIPSIWIKLSDSIQGGSFKFHDYFASVNRSISEPMLVSEHTLVRDVLMAIHPCEIDCDLDTLLEACPFRE